MFLLQFKEHAIKIITAVLIICSIIFSCCEAKEEILELADGYQIRWEVIDDKVFIKLAVKTKGWVGFGISINGAMDGADIVIGGVDSKTGEGYLQDRHGIGNIEPVMDKSQDYTLIAAAENETHTMLEFSRLLITCDSNDIPITWDSHKLIWATGKTDLLSFHGSDRRGVYAHNLMDPVQKMADLSSYNVWAMMTSLPLPNVETSYWCTLHKTPAEITEKQHMIGFDAVLKSQEAAKHTHHIDIYKCEIPDNIDTTVIFDPYLADNGHMGVDCYFPTDKLFPSKYCKYVQFGWTIGSKETIVPNNTGLPFYGNVYYMMEVHYDNPQELQNIPMKTGLELYYTPKLREIESGFLLLGSKIKFTQMIPPNSANFINAGHCGASCTQYFPQDGIHVYNILLHAHLSGRSIKVRHWRNGKELPWLINDDYFDFNFQQNRQLSQEIVVLPGDHMTIECLYDSRWKNNKTTLGGRSTREEMCEASFFYYPRMEFITECRSELPSAVTLPFLGIDKIYYDEDDGEEDPIVISPTKYKGQRYSTVIESLDWNQTYRVAYQQLHRYSIHDAECFPINGDKNADEKYPQVKEYIPSNQCNKSGHPNILASSAPRENYAAWMAYCVIIAFQLIAKL